MTMEFSVPYNGDPKLIGKLAGLRDDGGVDIREIFLSGPQEHSGSGRIAHNGNARQFAEAVHDMHARGFRVNLVMNSTCEGINEYSDQYADYLRDYVDYMTRGLGIEAMTVANPYLLAIVHEQAPDVEISASVLADVDCVERAQTFKRLGASVVTPDVAINRNLALLKRIGDESGLQLKIMVNEGCLHKCPYRKFHFNAMSHISANAAQLGRGLSLEQFKAQVNVVAGKTFFSMCNADLARDPSQILKSGWVRPEDLARYQDVTTFFKISGRTRQTDTILQTVKAYARQSWDGDLLELMDSSLFTYRATSGARLDNAALTSANFADHVLSCNRECASCGFCERLAKTAVSHEAAAAAGDNAANRGDAHEG